MIVLYFLMAMIPIVVIHELGHYWMGKRAGIKPEVFSVGFGPELFSWVRKDGAKWRIAALPLGGYVKFANDANGTSFPGVDPEKPKYLAPYWGKIATILAGPFFNFILSFLLFFAFAFFEGPEGDNTRIVRVNFELPNVENQIQSGDEIVEVGGHPISTYSELLVATAELPEIVEAVVLTENGNELRNLPNPHLGVIGGVIDGEPAGKSGIEVGDWVIGYGDVQSGFARDISQAIQQGGAEPHEIRISRGTDELAIEITPEISKNDEVARIGVFFASIYQSEAEPLSFGDSLQLSWRATNWVLIQSFSGIRDLINREIGFAAMESPVGIARIAGEAAERGFWDFVWLIAVLSSAIGFLNLLPIPILDGGHIVLLSYERVFGKLPPAPVINALFAIGIALLLGVMLITLSFDIIG